jgi:hypothetical protein
VQEWENVPRIRKRKLEDVSLRSFHRIKFTPRRELRPTETRLEHPAIVQHRVALTKRRLRLPLPG